MFQNYVSGNQKHQMNNTMFHETLKDGLKKACCSCSSLYILRITEHVLCKIMLRSQTDGQPLLLYPSPLSRGIKTLLALNPCERNTFSKRFVNASEIPCERKRFLKRFKLKRFIRNILANALRVNAALVCHADSSSTFQTKHFFRMFY